MVQTKSRTHTSKEVAQAILTTKHNAEEVLSSSSEFFNLCSERGWEAKIGSVFRIAYRGIQAALKCGAAAIVGHTYKTDTNQYFYVYDFGGTRIDYMVRREKAVRVPYICDNKTGQELTTEHMDMDTAMNVLREVTESGGYTKIVQPVTGEVFEDLRRRVIAVREKCEQMGKVIAQTEFLKHAGFQVFSRCVLLATGESAHKIKKRLAKDDERLIARIVHDYPERVPDLEDAMEKIGAVVQNGGGYSEIKDYVRRQGR